MTTLNPWINFNGNAMEAFSFYKSVFGGEFTKIVRMKNLESAEFPVAEVDREKLLRIELPIGQIGSIAQAGQGSVLIGNDVPSFMGTVSENENRSKIAVHLESREEAERIFKGLSEGGQVEMPLSESPWGTEFAMFRDKYGIEWVIEC